MDFLDFANTQYSGETQNNEPHGQGVMRFADGSKYTGGFECGQFSGDGQLEFAEGRIVGKWTRGDLLTYQIFFRDNLEFQEGQWDYITPQNRKYYSEITDAVPVAASRENPLQFPDSASMKLVK